MGKPGPVQENASRNGPQNQATTNPGVLGLISSKKQTPGGHRPHKKAPSGGKINTLPDHTSKDRRESNPVTLVPAYTKASAMWKDCCGTCQDVNDLFMPMD